MFHGVIRVQVAIFLWVQVLREVVGEVATASVATGVLGVGGNKGAVALGFTLHRRRVAILASHFAAHQVSCRRLLQQVAQVARFLRQAPLHGWAWASMRPLWLWNLCCTMGMLSSSPAIGPHH